VADSLTLILTLVEEVLSIWSITKKKIYILSIPARPHWPVIPAIQEAEIRNAV
jgi:hypothetical protein